MTYWAKTGSSNLKTLTSNLVSPVIKDKKKKKGPMW